MSKTGSNYERYNGDDRCQVERATGLGYINEVEMDAEFNDIKGALNQVIWRDGSAAMTGNLDMAGRNIQNLNQVTGNPVFLGAASIQNGLTVSGNPGSFNNGIIINNSFASYAPTSAFYGDMTVTGTINGMTMTNGTYTPEFTNTSGGSFAYIGQSGSYTQIGDLIICNIDIQGTLSGTPTATQFGVTLPFAASATEAGTGNIGYYGGIPNENGLYGYIAPSSSNVLLREGVNSTNTNDDIGTSTLDSLVYINLTVIYKKS